MKKYITGGVLVVAFTIYAFFTNNNNSSLAIVPKSSVTNVPTPSPTAVQTTSATTKTAGAVAVASNKEREDDDIGNDASDDDNDAANGIGSATVVATTVTPAPTPTPTPTPVPATTPTPITGNTGQYKNGTYTGSVADAFYGNLQVAAVIQGGALADVTFLQYPSNGHSAQVSGQALPILKQEAIAAQSANVNVVSGATQISQAFEQSLGSALALAAN